MDTTADQLRHAIARHREHLCQDVPPDRDAALLAILRAQDRLPPSPAATSVPDLITGHKLTNPGGNTALALVLDASGDGSSAGETIDAWAGSFLHACAGLAEAGLVLGHAETGFMTLVEDRPGRFSAWIATRRAPATWRERADLDWWASSLQTAHGPEIRALRDRLPGDPRDAGAYLEIARAYLKTMAWQLGYPPHIELGGLRVETWLDVLAGLIAWALRARDRDGMPTPVLEDVLISELATALLIPADIVREALDAFAIDRHTAAWHASVPGVAAAPLVRLDGDLMVASLYALTSEPLLFLTRELRRRDPQGYHNAAQHRETVFRQDLYEIFADKRFVTSAGTIRLRQGKGDLRTDIDAVVFDRKTGTLGLFELKSQDPFARSTAALARQRDNVLYANRQLAGALDWVRRYGAQELLGRVEAPTAKRFRAHKVYPFVLGRYLAHFGDGVQPDARAAWGTWPQVLRLLDEQPLRPGDANPIASLFARLQNDDTAITVPADAPPREIALGEARLVVHASYASYNAHRSEEDRS